MAGHGYADVATSAPETSATSETVMVDSSSETTQPATAHSDAISSNSQMTSGGRLIVETLAPINGVVPIPVGSEWSQRLEAVGIPPDSLWSVKVTPPTEEETAQLMAHRHYFMGWYYLELEQAGRAIDEFSEALKFDPDNPHILLDAARARLIIKEVTEARSLADRVLDQETTNVEAMRVKAETYLIAADAAQGDEKKTLISNAVKSLEQARKIQPKNLEVLRSLAKAYVLQQEVDKVLSVYRDVVGVDPRDTYSLLILAQLLSRMDRPEEAIPYYQRVIEQRPGFTGGYIYLGQLYERLKRYEDGLGIYKQALLVDPRNADVLRSFDELVQQIHGVNNKAQMLTEYEKFVNEYPLNTEIRRIFAERLEAAENLDGAAKQYEQILQVDPENIETLISLGKINSQQKNYDKAGEYLSKAVEINPEKIDLYDAIASTLLAKEDKEQAVAIYRKAIEANSSAEKLYISLAALLENDGKTSEAITVMEQAVAKVGEKPELLAVLGKFYRVTGDTEKAGTTLRSAYDKESENLPLFGELMSLYLEEGNTTAAEEITSRTAASAGVAKDVVLSVAAEFYFNAGRTEKSMDLYHQALLENPTKLDYLARLVGIANRQKLFERSLAYVEEFGGKAKDKEKIEQLKAEIYLASEQYDKAITIYKSLLSNNPLDLNYYQYLVDAYNEAKRYDESVKVVKDAQKRFNKSDPEALLMMTGMVYYKQEKYAQAEKAFLDLIKRTNGKSDDAYYFLGSVYLDQERYTQAETQFRKAIEVNPTSANALNALGYMFADQNIRLDEAKELVSQALDINPTAPHILDSMGWILFKEGDLEGAEEYVERASRQYEDAEIFSHLAAIYEKQGKKVLAKEMYKRALELDPDSADLKQKLTNISANGAQ